VLLTCGPAPDVLPLTFLLLLLLLLLCRCAQAAALEELGSRDAQLSAQKAALDERGAELEGWAAQVSKGGGGRGAGHVKRKGV
jgi:hypothetical protein